MADYNFDQDLSTDRWDIKIDTKAGHGCFERYSDGEGGELTFERTEHGVKLVDYDGVSELSGNIVKALRDAGYYLDDTYD